MDLWIRSQNKKELIPNPKLGIDQCENRYYIVDRYNFENAFILGEYKSKERALEVLDEIQNLLIPKTIVNTFNIEKKDMLNGNQYSIFENNIKDFSIEQFDTYVYKMPKEQE